jgi:hypothetical protein
MENSENIQNEERGDQSYVLSNEEINELVMRKMDFLAGNSSARPWSEIKKEFEIKKNQIRNRNSEIRNSK